MRTLICLFISLLSYAHTYGNNNINNSSLACGTTINSFPYQESFEGSFGAWTEQISSNIWRNHSGSTSSYNTGPTGANHGSYYMYMEASSPNYPNKTAVLEGPCFNLSGASYANFQFQYHMWGSAMGSLQLEASLDNGVNWFAVWSKSGNQDNAWYGASVDLSAYAGETIQLRFYGETGANYYSDIAIDNLYFTTSANQNPAPCNTTVSNFPYTEGFEGGTGNWTEQVSSNIWRRHSGGTGSSGTGPSSAAAGSYYFYTEASSPNYPSKTAILESPCFDLSDENVAYFSFDYHLYGSYMGSLSLEVSTDGAINWTSVWSETGNQGNAWYSKTIDLSAYTGQEIRLRFYGVTGTSYTSDMAIDKLELTTVAPIANTGCSSVISTFPYQESFESSWGNWTENNNNTLDIWRRHSGGTGSSGTGPSSAYDGTYYVYTEASYPNYPNKIGLLEGPCFDLSGAAIASLQFQYHMYGAYMGTLDLQVNTNNGVGWSTIWSQSGDKGNNWHEATADLSAYVGGTIKLRFKGTTGSNYVSDMAIDGLVLSAPTSANGNLAGSVQFPFTTSCSSGYQLCCDSGMSGGNVANVGITIDDLDNGGSYFAITDAGGNFSQNITGAKVALSTTVQGSSWNTGVSTYDLSLLQNHINGTYLIDCPLRRLAGDADNDGDLDNDDINLIQQLILGQISSFPNASNWQLVSKNYANSDDSHPDKRFEADFWNTAKEDALGADYPFKGIVRSGGVSYDYNGSNSWVDALHATTFDPNPLCAGNEWGFYIVKTGDLSGNASYSSFTPPSPNSLVGGINDNVMLEERLITRNQGISAAARNGNEEYEVRLVAATPIKVQAYQMTIQFDDEIVELGKIKPNKDYLNQVEAKNFGQAIKTVRGGSFKTLWTADLSEESAGKDMSEGVTLFAFEFKSKESLEVVRNAIQLDNALLESAFYGADGLIEEIDLQIFIEATK